MDFACKLKQHFVVNSSELLGELTAKLITNAKL